MLGCPMTDFESMKALFQLLKVPDSPGTHWSANSGWDMVESMFHMVTLKMWEKTFHACFISTSADEVTTIDTSSWISIHLYYVKDWERVLVLLLLTKLKDDGRSKVVTTKIMDALTGNTGNLNWGKVVRKLVSFGANGAPIFQKSGVIACLQKDNAPFLTGMHYCTHRTKLCVEKLDKLPIVKKIEALC